MKNTGCNLFLLFIALITCAHSPETGCEGYYPSDKGVKMEITNYNAKGKPESVLTTTVVDVITLGDVTTWKLHGTSKDEKGKNTFDIDYDASCKNGTFFINMKNMITGDQMKAYENMDVKISADNLDFPVHPSPGQTLNDGHLTMEISLNGMGMPGFRIDIVNRKVEGMESITTPAGTFECVKISYDFVMKSIVKIEGHSIQWFSKNNGMIRSESYRKEKLQGYSELTSVLK